MRVMRYWPSAAILNPLGRPACSMRAQCSAISGSSAAPLTPEIAAPPGKVRQSSGWFGVQ